VASRFFFFCRRLCNCAVSPFFPPPLPSPMSVKTQLLFPVAVWGPSSALFPESCHDVKLLVVSSSPFPRLGEFYSPCFSSKIKKSLFERVKCLAFFLLTVYRDKDEGSFVPLSISRSGGFPGFTRDTNASCSPPSC